LKSRYTLPSKRYFTENVVTKIYESLKDEVSTVVNGVEYFNFTIDI